MVTTRLPSSRFMHLSLDMSRSGRFEELKKRYAFRTDISESFYLMQFTRINVHKEQVFIIFLPYFPDTTCRMLPIPLVGGHNELHLVTLHQHVATLDFGHVEE